MKKTIFIVAGVVALAGITAAAIFLPKGRSGTEVYLSKVEAGKVVSVVSANGEIQPRTKVNISSNVWGQIIGIPVKEGDLVRKGDVLVRIDPTQYQSQVRSLEASLRMARVAEEQELNRNKTLQTQFRRAEGLRTQGILDEASYDDSRLSFDSSTIQLRSLKESIEQAEASLQKARDDLGKTTIFAPMDGKVTQLNTEVGEQVIVGTTNVPGSSIMVISDMSEVLAEVDVDETEVVRVAVAQPAKVSVDAVEKREYHGHVTEIRNSASKKNDVNVFGVKVQLDDPDERLRPGMSARARIEIEQRAGVLRIPIQAVVEKTRKAFDEEIAKASGGSKGKGEAKTKEAAKTAEAAKPKEAAKAGDAAATKEAATTKGAGETTRTATAPGAGEATTRPGADVLPVASTAGKPAAEPAKTGSAAAKAESDPAKTAPESAKTGSEPAKAGSEPARTGSGAAKPGSSAESAAAPEAASKPPEEQTVELVYVMRDGKAAAVEVKTGLSDESNVEILSGLKDGDMVVTGPYRTLRKLKHGDRVMEKKEEEVPGEATSKDETKEK